MKVTNESIKAYIKIQKENEQRRIKDKSDDLYSQSLTRVELEYTVNLAIELVMKTGTEASKSFVCMYDPEPFGAAMNPLITTPKELAQEILDFIPTKANTLKYNIHSRHLYAIWLDEQGQSFPPTSDGYYRLECSDF